MGRLIKFDKDNLKYCIVVVVAFVLPLVISAVLIVWSIVAVAKIVFIWRVIFMVNVVCEIIILTCLLLHVRQSLQTSSRSLPWGLVWTMGGTLWMRVGIVCSIILKLCGVLDKRYLKVGVDSYP